MGPALALLPILFLGGPRSTLSFCEPTRLTADLESGAREAAENLRREEKPYSSLEDRARWRSVLPAVTFRSSFSERTATATGSGTRFYSEIDSETVLTSSSESGLVNQRTSPTGVTVTATWNLMPLLFSSGENAARVFRRESYMRSRRRSRELLEAVETARGAIRRVEMGAGSPVLECIEAQAAVEKIRHRN
ncbi:MAG: hypothetical protein HYT87_03925 [Nitrospirae bacterium]|nr:hypothetical protein [Nitrospirota bacterium]